MEKFDELKFLEKTLSKTLQEIEELEDNAKYLKACLSVKNDFYNRLIIRHQEVLAEQQRKTL